MNNSNISDGIQLDLFGYEDLRPKPKRSGNNKSIIFHDYESFLAKFNDIPKTTDDCFTPQDVFEAVVAFVGSKIDMKDKVILRPFFPGGDYINAIYPKNGIIIDNPPFSIFTDIIKFYTARQIPFFLFGQGKTIFSCCKYCTAIIVSDSLTYENGARIYTNFASNLFGDTIVMTAPKLNDMIFSCPSQSLKANLPTYKYPRELLSFSQMQTICRGGLDFSVNRNECQIVRNIDNHPKSLFGDHILLSSSKADEKTEAVDRAKEYIRMKIEKSDTYFNIELSERECRIIKRLNKNN